ncbi:MAG: FtsX-like permease family protein [Candidatus Scalindua rubra]|nr:FtsX-like permease family protein [Candidatus Scalindua rubra]
MFKILFRNAFRHKLRTFLTVCGMAVAILSFGLLRTVIDAWYIGVEASSETRLVTRNSISLIFRLPLAYRDTIRRVDGVEIVSYGNWFGGYYIDRKDFFANFAVEPKSYLELYPEYVIPDDQKVKFTSDRKGCLVGKKLADRFGWSVGDTVTLTGTIFPGKWDFILRGIYEGRTKNIDETLFFFHWNYLNESIKKIQSTSVDHVGFYIIGIENPYIAAETSEAIDKFFKNSLAETLTETEKAFQLGFVAMSEAIIKAIQLISLVIIFIILIVVANTMGMSVRERIGEYAVLKTLGFRARQITMLIMGESMVITIIGGITGIILTFPAAMGFSLAVGQFFPVFNITGETLYLDMAVTVTVGLLAGIFPAYRAVTVRIAEGLRRIG